MYLNEENLDGFTIYLMPDPPGEQEEENSSNEDKEKLK